MLHKRHPRMCLFGLISIRVFMEKKLFFLCKLKKTKLKNEVSPATKICPYIIQGSFRLVFFFFNDQLIELEECLHEYRRKTAQQKSTIHSPVN